MSVKVSEHFGIVIQKRALVANCISRDKLLEVLEATSWFDEDNDLISAGPHFGGEVASEFIMRLEKLGLTYGEDFIDFSDMLPAWCTVSISYNPA